MKNNNQLYKTKKISSISDSGSFYKVEVFEGRRRQENESREIFHYSCCESLMFFGFVLLTSGEGILCRSDGGETIAWRQQYDFIWKHLKSFCLHFARSLHRVRVTPWSRTADFLRHRRFCFCLIACFSIFREHTRKWRLKSILKKPSPPPVAEETALKR